MFSSLLCNPDSSHNYYRNDNTSKRSISIMPKLYCDANPRCIAYVLDGGGSNYQMLPEGHTSMEAEYLAISYGLNEYFLKWNTELDPRYYSGKHKVSSPSDDTRRPLPPPVLICCDNEVVVKQLSRQYHIGNDRLRKLAQQIWQQCQNIDVKFAWVPRGENLAGKMLK